MVDSALKPLVGIPASQIYLPAHSLAQHGVGERYIRGVYDGAGAVPMIIPALADDYDFEDLASRLDGLMLTGGRANVEPHHYDGKPFPDDEVRDPPRDNTVLPLIRECVKQGIPVFGSCRGIQEINVAMGGTLHYRVHEVEGFNDHRMPREGDMEHKFSERHLVVTSENGFFHKICDSREIMVNSLHAQAVDEVAPGFEIECVSAPDGVIEGISYKDTETFCVGVQWHVEWRFEANILSQGLWHSFGDACRARATARANVKLAAE
ncbi:MAG: Gamma-glutamyl-gamma-aminobutyrate hydrolase PuuD [Alphaproteobacteria bacterium MarineAlpha11_Bin1]|nr:MAG: Gamma-glutamyl-gamma-aminobutyrate hydrolase PuuD [Alphaproteobacteria bacterium MarineAlpha11_Bin1]|tara:strand:- start:47205 stop:47999 length:795 start_codon:yes stop_codon:yes gene_type:complete